MKISNVVCEERCSGIPLKGWESVKVALQAYSQGKARGARAATNHQFQSLDQGRSGGMVAAMTLFAGVLRDRPDAFVERMLAEAEEKLKNSDRWRGSYDYDAMGTNFFKTSVEIERWDKKEDIYVLSINAAYVGDKPEMGLADYLGVPRALMCHTIVVTVEPINGTRFEFDFDELYRGLGSALGLSTDVGKRIAEHMMGGDKLDGPGGIVLKEDGDVQATLYLGRVAQRFTFKDGKVVADNWKAEGAVLSGLLADSYEDRTKKALPTFGITISRKPRRANQFGSTPVWDNELRQKMAILAENIGSGMLVGQT